jgi:hypothetical protein
LLIIEVGLPTSEDASLETLDSVESDLLAQSQRLSELSRRKDPFANITVILAARAEDWEATSRAIEEME